MKNGVDHIIITTIFSYFTLAHISYLIIIKNEKYLIIPFDRFVNSSSSLIHHGVAAGWRWLILPSLCYRRFN